jgi:ClpA/ClpB-like protein/sigma-70-like protein
MPFSNHKRRQDRLTWLAEIYRTYAADLQYFISHKVGDPTVAEDLTSTVFLKALRWLREDQSEAHARGWLYATARTTIVDYWQAQSQYETHAKYMAPESRRVLDLAREEMLALSHWWIGTEHLLWGLASEESLSSFLTPLLITPERIHAGIVFIFDREKHQGQSGQGSSPLADVSSDALKLLTPRAKQMIFLAAEEMKSQGEQSIRPTHLLLGLLHEGEGIGAGLLRSLGVSLFQARTALIPPAANQRCSFCGRSSSQVVRFFPAVVGEASSSALIPGALICDHCVRRFSTMLGSA